MINAVVLNFKRPENMSKVIEGIRSQTVKSRIIVIDNSGTFDQPGADIVLKTGYNFNCLPRFFVPGWIPSEYVFQSDDDKYISDKTLFEKLIEESDTNPTSALCYNGRILNSDRKCYQDGFEINSPIVCSVCNFGFSFYPSWVMNTLPASPYSFDGKEITFDEMKYADDLWVSSFVECRVSAHIRKALTDLPEGPNEITYSKVSGHMEARNEIGRRFFTSKGIV